MTKARHQLADLLAGDQATPRHSAQLKLPSEALTLSVDDVGTIHFPVRAADAKRLIAAARPALFGKGEETLSDTSVRDTWELTPEQVTLGGAEWRTHLDAALDHFRDELALPVGSSLRAELHSLLVYGKGQFFLPHQDSEKHDDMVATLVVSLPSIHSGGELVIDDGGAEQVHRGSRDDLVLVAFYADRRHEVRPVLSGYRITLTFNLMLTGPTATADAGPVGQAAALLTDHFSTRATSRYGDRDLGEPTRLTFLLDHEYTQTGLKAGRFKGADADRVAVLRRAAEVAGCECAFALAEIQETWDAVPAGRRYDDYDLNSLIDDSTALGWWVRPDGTHAETISLSVSDHEVCAVTPTQALTPYESEYEGYMGNYGNTVDRWYRRAAVVVWPQEKAFAARAEAGSDWALRALVERMGAGDLDGARADARSLEPFWRHVGADALAPSLEVAAGLRDPVAARVVLAPFHLEMLTPDHGEPLAAVAEVYDDAWLRELVAGWDAQRLGGQDRPAWTADQLVPVGRALRERGAVDLAEHLTDRIWRWAARQLDIWLASDNIEMRCTNLLELGRPLARVLQAASEDTGEAIVETLCAANESVLELLVRVLREHPSPPTSALLRLAENCRIRLARVVEAPARAADDWSIPWAGCGCRECEHLGAFLTSPIERTLEWPLAKPGRQHVHQRIDNAGLPVRHTTRRQGRPFTLVLTKTEALFDREKQARQQATIELAWVTSTFG